MFNLRRVFTFLAVMVFSLAVAGHSQAQLPTGTSVTLNKTGISHSRQNRGNNLLNTQINYDDCHLDDAINVSVSLSGWTGLTLQTWAGSSCEVQQNRIQPNLLNCWQIGADTSPSANNPPPIQVPVKGILYGRTLASGASTGTSAGTAGTGGTDATAGTGGTDATAGTGGTAGSVAGATSTPTTSDDAACTQKNAATTAQTINVYFMLVDPGNNIVGTFVTWPLLYKLLAPAPPGSVHAGVGENLLPISFNPTNTSDTTINGYNLYCDPAPGSAAAADAGVLPDDAGPLPIPSCIGSTVLAPGAHPNSENLCGSAGKSSNKGNATGLINGVAYTVAVATVDSYGNSGVLSDTDCNVPQPVTGFFKAYRNAGGRGGGGFCSFSPRREPFPLFAVVGCVTYLILRRRRAA